MKKYANLIISLASLFVTLFLLILSIFGWYIANTQATASGIIATAEGLNGSFTFYYWDTKYVNETPVSEWKSSTNSLVVKDAEPDDVFYFKIVGTNLTEGQKIRITFEGITSSIDETAVKGSLDTTDAENPIYKVSYNNIVRYSSSTSDIDVTHGTTKTLYSLEEDENYASGYKVDLEDILIEDRFRIYKNPVITGSHQNNNDIPSEGQNPTYEIISGDIYNGTVSSSEAGNNNQKVMYFALKFVSEGSDELDNHYQFQGLNITHINITQN